MLKPWQKMRCWLSTGTTDPAGCWGCRDWDAEKKEWGWARPPPISQKSGGDPDTPKKLRKKVLLPLYY